MRIDELSYDDQPLVEARMVWRKMGIRPNLN